MTCWFVSLTQIWFDSNPTDTAAWALATAASARLRNSHVIQTTAGDEILAGFFMNGRNVALGARLRKRQSFQRRESSFVLTPKTEVGHREHTARLTPQPNREPRISRMTRIGKSPVENPPDHPCRSVKSVVKILLRKTTSVVIVVQRKAG
ncbi:MAG: hypothetical protein HY043_20260 [Verrucomicrobia bacterium]|nr:hypothetical protein [Verrucomicrobiota bacterium]